MYVRIDSVSIELLNELNVNKKCIFVYFHFVLIYMDW